MPTPWFAPLLRCPECRQPVRWNAGNPICSSCDATFEAVGESVLLPTNGGSSNWAAMQDESVERYEAHHYNLDTTIPRLFGGFMATTLDRSATVLDVGCGISPDLPPYVVELELEHYLGLEPLTVRVQRHYPCLVGALAEKTPLDDASVDALIYATSLDHIEDVPSAMREARRILEPDGKAYFWVGLNEPEVVSRAMAPLHSWIYKGSGARKVVSLALPHAVLGRSLLQLGVRSYKLRRGIPLDQAHFRYYTRATLGKELRDGGFRIVRELLVPGSSSIFVECASTGPDQT